MEHRKKSWKEFTKTGRVSDYLEYRGCIQSGTGHMDAGTVGSTAEVNQHAVDRGRPGGPGQEYG